MPRQARDSDERNLAVNRRARRDYSIEETFEGGLVLVGTEVKSAREGRIELKDAYARVKNGEVWLASMHIAPYSHAYRDNHDPERRRKVLLHRHQIRRLVGKTERAGYSLVPLRVYLKGTRIKVELALGRGRTKGERKEELRRRIADREVRQELSRRGRSFRP